VAFGVDMTDPQPELAALNTLIFLTCIFGLAGVVIGWVVIDFLRRLLDALHTLIAQGSARRQWAKVEREG
jgi:hypothetical protein